MQDSRRLVLWALIFCVCVCVCVCVHARSVTQSCLTLYDPVDSSMPGSSVLHSLLEIAQIHIHWASSTVLLRKAQILRPFPRVPRSCPYLSWSLISGKLIDLCLSLFIFNAKIIASWIIMRNSLLLKIFLVCYEHFLIIFYYSWFLCCLYYY